MAATQGQFVWYELMTTDVAAAKIFYGKVVGWSMEDMPGGDMPYTILKLADGTGIGGIMERPKLAENMPPYWFGYVWADNVDDAADKVKSLGGAVHVPPRDIPGIGRFSVVADPLGAVFNLFHSTHSGDGDQPRTPQPGRTGWHELHTNDWPKAFDFYNAMFGWTKGESVDMGSMGAYQLFVQGGQPIGGMFNSPAAGPHRFWQYYFMVDDIDAGAARVVEAGGKILNGPHQVPGGGWIVQAADPQGALFALLGAKA